MKQGGRDEALEAETPRVGRIGSIGEIGVGFSEGGVRVGVGGVVGQQADGMGGVEREIVMVGPWGSLDSLRGSREEALQRLMVKKGHDLSKEVALNASELYAENAKWAEMDEVCACVCACACVYV